MSGKLLAWIVFEGIVGTKNFCYKQVGLFSDTRQKCRGYKEGQQKSLQHQEVCLEYYLCGNEWQESHR